MTDDEFIEFLYARDMEEQRRLEAEEEATYHAEQQLEHELQQAARFLLAHESLPEIWVRMGNMAMGIDYGKQEEAPF